MDGAMGTQLLRMGLQLGEPPEEWNVRWPERVQQVHREYTDAGAQVHLTNTFQLLAHASRQEDPLRVLVHLQQTALKLCRQACGPEGFVLVDFGPYGKAEEEEFSDLSLPRQAFAHCESADGILLETCSTPGVFRAVRCAQQLNPDLPVLLSLTYLRGPNGELQTFRGLSPEWFAEQAQTAGVAALGVNCGRDIDRSAITQIIQRYRQVTNLPLFARPNAGTPGQGAGEKGSTGVPELGCLPSFSLTPVLPNSAVSSTAGVSMIGGCCGTTPAHIRALGEVLSRHQ